MEIFYLQSGNQLVYSPIPNKEYSIKIKNNEGNRTNCRLTIDNSSYLISDFRFKSEYQKTLQFYNNNTFTVIIYLYDFILEENENYLYNYFKNGTLTSGNVTVTSSDFPIPQNCEALNIKINTSETYYITVNIKSYSGSNIILNKTFTNVQHIDCIIPILSSWSITLTYQSVNEDYYISLSYLEQYQPFKINYLKRYYYQVINATNSASFNLTPNIKNTELYVSGSYTANSQTFTADIYPDTLADKVYSATYTANISASSMYNKSFNLSLNGKMKSPYLTITNNSSSYNGTFNIIEIVENEYLA